nr:hypothetical protein [Tanacetum cinerariifolium]
MVASGVVDLVDPSGRSVFGVRRKSSPEKFSGGGGGGGRRQEVARKHGGDDNLPLVFVPKVYSTSQSDTMDLFIKDMECEERLLRLVRITPPTCYGIQIVISDKNQRISKGFVDTHELRGYASAVVSHRDKKFKFKLFKKSKSVEIFSTTTQRGILRSGFWHGQ